MTSKKDTLPHIIRNLINVDGEKLQEILDALAAFVPTTAENIASINASSIEWDIPAPAEAFPSDTYRTGGNIDEVQFLQEAPNLSLLGFDPLYTSTYGLRLNRQYASNALLEEGKQSIGWLAPGLFLNKFCAIVCDGVNGRVYIVAPAGGPEGLTVQKLAEFKVGAGPQHACQTSDGTIYVTCDDGAGAVSIWRIRNGVASEFITDATLTTASVDGLRKIYTNRSGTFLYAIANESTAYFDSILQIKVADGTVAVQTIDRDAAGSVLATASAAEEIVDLVVTYPDERSGESRKSYIAVAQSRSNGGTTGTLWMMYGDDGVTGNASWGSLDLSDTADVSRLNNPTGQANEHLRAMVTVGSSLFILASYTNEVDTSWAVISYDEQQHDAGAIGDGFSTITSGTDTQSWATTGASDCYGSACATPQGVYAIIPNGDVLYWPRGSSSVRIFTPRGGWSAGTGTTVSQGSSVAFLGRCIMVQATDTAADGESLIMRPW